jgi:hypothetical protein
MLSITKAMREAAERIAHQLRCTDRSQCGSSASGCQNSYDLVDAQRRRVQALVVPPGEMRAFLMYRTR